LAEAREMAAGLTGSLARFEQADLLTSTWNQATGGPAEAVVCLAVLHHIPTAASRATLLRQAAVQLAPGGQLIVSTWQFMDSDRLRRRVLPWETVGLSAADVEPGDYLVSWGEGAAGHRYCAYIDEAALAALAARAGLRTLETFRADGHEGNLNLYGIYGVGG
jgi:2-polyprenyl-3-methyl-5-hydroxy-6-metoxy-1,4-benzoquinol methylase